MLLFVDNYDSFSWNLARYFCELGVPLRLHHNDSPELAAILQSVPNEVTSICISPGPGKPEDSGLSMSTLQWSASFNLPLLGVCLGHQCLAEYHGAKIVRGDRPMHGKVSELDYSAQGLFTGFRGDFNVGRYHSLAVEKESLPDELVLDALAKDDKAIMAIRHRSLPHYGVQFHPESVLSERGHELLGNFLKLAHARR